jgi:hypothetical protein
MTKIARTAIKIPRTPVIGGRAHDFSDFGYSAVELLKLVRDRPAEHGNLIAVFCLRSCSPVHSSDECLYCDATAGTHSEPLG